MYIYNGIIKNTENLLHGDQKRSLSSAIVAGTRAVALEPRWPGSGVPGARSHNWCFQLPRKWPCSLFPVALRKLPTPKCACSTSLQGFNASLHSIVFKCRAYTIQLFWNPLSALTFPESKNTFCLKCQQKGFWNEAGGSFLASERSRSNFSGDYDSICWCDYGNSGRDCEVLCTLLSLYSLKDGGLPAMQSVGKGWKQTTDLEVLLRSA